MEPIDVSYPLPAPLVQLLIALVEAAEQDQVLTVNCVSASSPHEYGTWDYHIESSRGTKDIEGVKGAALDSLTRLGFVERLGDRSITVFLHPSAFERARYERKGRFGKWVIRTVQHARDVILAVSFTLAVLLAVLQIIEIVDKLR